VIPGEEGIEEILHRSASLGTIEDLDRRSVPMQSTRAVPTLNSAGDRINVQLNETVVLLIIDLH